MRKYVETLHKATSYTSCNVRTSTIEAVNLSLRHHGLYMNKRHYMVVNGPIWMLQTPDQHFLVAGVTRKSTMEWQGLKHALECFILNFDKAIKTSAWISITPCDWWSSTKIVCEKVSFAMIGWTNQQQTTHPNQIDWSIAWESNKNNRNYTMMIPFE